MLVTISWLENNYNKYNNLYWNGELPKIKFIINNSKRTWGFASYTYNRTQNWVKCEAITLSNYYDSPEEVKLNTLLHEMIHIADYYYNPNHFVCGGKKVRYDAHGWWFKQEAARLSKYGWDIEKYVTLEAQSVSTLSERSVRLEQNKIDNSLVCVVYGANGYNWFFKTNIYHVKDCLNTIKRCNWSYLLDSVIDIKFYKFEDKSLSMMRSSASTIRGFKYDSTRLNTRLENIKASFVEDYKILAKNTVSFMNKN